MAELSITCPNCSVGSSITDPNRPGERVLVGVLDGVEVYAEQAHPHAVVKCPACDHVWEVEITTENIEEQA